MVDDYYIGSLISREEVIPEPGVMTQPAPPPHLYTMHVTMSAVSDVVRGTYAWLLATIWCVDLLVQVNRGVPRRTFKTNLGWGWG